jgi:uncharacterized protein (DUF2249 family)
MHPDPMQTTQNDPTEHIVDVRPVFARGDAPCEVIDQAAERVAPGQTLVLLVPFEPIPLYKKLEALGFTAKPAQVDDGTWRISFHRAHRPPQSAVKIPVSCACGH